MSLDFLRGFAIWMMIVFHVFMYSWSGIDNLTDADYVLKLSPLLLILAFVLIQLGTWAGLFILISMCVNVIAMKHRIDDGTSLKKVRNKQIFTGSLVLLLGYLIEMTISYSGFIGKSLIQRKIVWSGLHYGLLAWKALNVIGLCVIISSILLYELYKDNGHLQIRRNITILAALTLIVLILTPILDWVIRSYIYSWWSTDDSSTQFKWPPQSFAELILRMLLVALNGYMQPLFPYLSTAFIGTMFGMVLSQDNPNMKFPRYGMLTGVFCIILGIVLILLGINAETPINFRQEVPWFLIALGGQIFAVSFFLWIVEFKGHINSFKYLSTFWRRWGMMALSIYCLQIIDYPLKILVYLISGEKAHVKESLSFEWSLFMVILTIIWFDLILRIWARYDFKYSFEWIIVQLTTKSRGMKSKRTQVKAVIHDVEPIIYVNKK